MTRPSPTDKFEIERRYLLGRAAARSFLERVSPHVSHQVYDRQRPVAYTRTTYLDTDDSVYARSAITGVATRVRIREYAAAAVDEKPVFTGLCALEYKQSAGDTRRKQRFEAPPEFLGTLIAEQPSRWAQDILRTPRLRPLVATWYRRVSLGDRTGNVRITLDEGARFLLPRRLGMCGEAARPGNGIGRMRQRVLEIKHAGPAPAWLAEAACELGQPASLSKFDRAVATLRKHSGSSLPLDHTAPLPILSPMVVVQRKAS